MNNKKIINKFTNLIMKDGKKSIAFNLLKKGIKGASIELNIEEKDLLNKVLENVKPLIDARSKRVGRNSYIIPYAITEDQSINLGLKIIVRSTRLRKEKSFLIKLKNEFIDIFNNRGASIKQRNEIHKLAEANKSFAFYR